MIVIRWHEESLARRAIGAAAFLVLMIIFSVARMGWTAELRSFCKFVLILLVLDVIWYLRGRGPVRIRDFILTAHGLLIRDLRGERSFSPWSEIVGARYRLFTARLTVQAADGRTIVNAIARNRPSRSAARMLVREIAHRLARVPS